MANKFIKRDAQGAGKIFDNRTLQKDFRTLTPLLLKGIAVLDVGCGTGAITKDIAGVIGESGSVIGIDNTEKFISSGKETYGNTKNMKLIHTDLFDFRPVEKFDLIVSARTMQWLSNVPSALLKIKSLLKSDGKISILDYNHKKIEWLPTPPDSMRIFYDTFLRWREDAGMSNQMADELPELLKDAGFSHVEKLNADELYQRGDQNFSDNIGIWSKVAGSNQMVEEGYMDDDVRLKAIAEYNHWIENEAVSMKLKLSEVRAVN